MFLISRVCLISFVTTLSFSALAADQSWTPIDGGANSQKFFIKKQSIAASSESKSLRNFMGMFNIEVEEGGQKIEGSIVGQFTLDCDQKKLRTNSTKTYEQFDAKGDILGESPGDAEFFPLNDEVRAQSMLSVVCGKK